MKTQTLSICVPNTGCTRDCPYCISKITGNIDFNYGLYYDNLHNKKLETFAKATGVTNILLTGKGEPFFDLNILNQVTDSFITDYPLEIQTNGDLISFTTDFASSISSINVIAISVDSIKQLNNLKEKISFLKRLNKIVRITYLLRYEKEWGKFPEMTLNNVHYTCKSFGVDQLTFRRITFPEKASSNIPAVDWIKRNVPPDVSEKWYKEINDEIIRQGTLVRKLNFGTSIYDILGLSVTAFDFCVQEQSGEDDIRTLIYQEDGHLYTSWSSKASIIF